VSHRYRLYPTREQQLVLVRHCADARFVWNLALEQCACARRVGRYADQQAWDRQLTEARRAFPWLADGSVTVQQQALRDLRQAFRNWWANPGHFGHPTWRRKGLHEGFRAVGASFSCETINRRWARVRLPKVGWIRFRLSRPLPAGTKSARVTVDRAGRWHVSFTAVPDRIAGPGDGTIVGVDRGVAVDFQASDGRRWDVPALSGPERRRLRLLQRRLARQQKGSNRRARTKHAIAKIRAREADRRKDTIEKATTELARTADVVRIEDLKVRHMMRSASGTLEAPGRNVAQKRGLNRSIAETGWTMFATRLEHKIGTRLERVPAAYTSQRCHECGHTAAENRKSQAVFSCLACGHTANADLNAAKNIAAGQAVRARGETPPGDSTNREPPQDVSHAA
jgi:putative transposase